ncbi:MAG: aromatic amino acid lyase, partial [Firmicutes bacterium]|nr:aromatic amino acid lyase [Bacillota bacterium]
MICIDGNHLTIEDIVAVARQKEKVSISPAAKEAIDRASRMISNIVSQGEVVYGVTTGFGKLAHVTISQKETSELQKNLIRSHAVGVGDNLPEEVVRAIMLLRANTLAKGHSGIRLEVIQLLVDMLNCGLHPVIPSQGSVGASGDLVPLAHMTLPLIGEGEILLEGSIVSGKTALQRFGLEPVELEAKEGLALINGTAVMTAIAALA